MTDILERTDVDSLDDVDFEPVCSIILRTYGVRKPCDRPAKWAGTMPCCGKVGLICEHHFEVRHTRPFVCSKCPGPRGVHNDLINWRRL